MSSRRCQFICLAVAAGLLVVGGLLVARRLLSKPDAASTNKTENEIVPSWQSPLVVEVMGHEFEWSFRYPGADGKFDTQDDIRVEKDLHIPVDTDIVLQLHSDDYIYTFSLPELELKEIAVPNLMFTLSFRASTPGNFELLADPLCNFRFYHDELMGRLKVQNQSEFSDWLTSQE